MSVTDSPSAQGTKDFKVVDVSSDEFQRLANYGRQEITLAEAEMPALMALRKKYPGKK